MVELPPLPLSLSHVAAVLADIKLIDTDGDRSEDGNVLLGMASVHGAGGRWVVGIGVTHHATNVESEEIHELIPPCAEWLLMTGESELPDGTGWQLSTSTADLYSLEFFRKVDLPPDTVPDDWA